MTQQEATERAARGAALLDASYPGWEHRIDLDLLEQRSCAESVLGQLYDGFEQGYDKLYETYGKKNGSLEAAEKSVADGFDLSPDDGVDKGNPWDSLQQAWVALITERRKQKESETAP